MSPHKALRLQLLFALGCNGAESPDDTARDSELQQTTACMGLEEAGGSCPAAEDVSPASLTPALCGTTVVSVVGGPREEDCWYGPGGDSLDHSGCVYDVTVSGPNDCDYGRPFATQSCAAARADWSLPLGPRPDDSRRLAAEWTAIGLAEHASVASFARFVLELLAHGAPAELVRDANQAMADEVRHAELAFGLASAYAGEAVGPGPLPVHAVQIGDLCAMAAACVREGCLAETRSVLMLTERAGRETDPVVAEILRTLAADEGRHAALAWRAVQWAVGVGGERVQRAVAEAFGAASEDAAWEEVIRPVAMAAGFLAMAPTGGDRRPGPRAGDTADQA